MEIFGELKELTNLRDYWKDEARDFTPWLSKNIELLADAVNLQITVEETESRSGKYRADILASEERTGQKIIIENQLEDLDHKHIGQAITYAKVKEAEIIIWVVKHADDEQRTTIRKMNNDTDNNFGHFLCEIRLYSIDNSKPAVKFEVIEKPAANWFKKFSTKKNHYKYWTNFQKYASHNKEFAENFSCNTDPSSNRNMNFSIGGGDVYFLKIWKADKNNNISAEFFSRNEDLIIKLREKKNAIESATNLHFDWSNEKRISIKKSVSLDDVKIFEQFDWLIDVMIRMKKTFVQYL